MASVLMEIFRHRNHTDPILKEQQVKAIVIACNTASAFALDAVQHEQDIPVLGVIGAGAKVAAEETVNKRVGVIGTVGTVGSGIHEAYLKKMNDLSGVADNRISGFTAVWNSGCITKINNLFRRKITHDLTCHCQATYSGIKHTDRCISIYLHM